MKNCDKQVFVKILQKYKPCIKAATHRGKCTANLIGEKFGRMTILRLGKPRVYTQKARGGKSIWNGKQTTWVVSQDGIEREVYNSSLISGMSSGKVSLSAFLPSRYKNGKSRPEYNTVRSHWAYIFNPDYRTPTYRGLPFFDDWNPVKGGGFWKGAKWIIEHLGKKPGKNWSIDIIKHAKGFVPGNLRWANYGTQATNKYYKILGRLTTKQLKVEARRHGYKLVKL